jgi:phosphatidylserine/phosphatidylglycerophosphate/cardiolipin synthase-like enzyme
MKMEFIRSKGFYNDLTKELQSPSEEILLHFFKFNSIGIPNELRNALITQIKSGCKINIRVDAVYSKYNLMGGGFYYPLIKKGIKKNEDALARNEDFFAELKKLGAEITYINYPNIINIILPFCGRDHRKLVLIKREENSIFYFGAQNITKKDMNDFMIKVTDKDFVDDLAKISTPEFLSSLKSDYSYKPDEENEFLLDRGRNFRSIIQKTAYKMISKSKKEIWFVSQLPAEMPLLLNLILVKLRGAKVHIIIPGRKHRNISHFPFIIFYYLNYILCKIFKMELIHCKQGFSHAKVLITDDEVLLGSHNLSTAGVYFGTVEFSLRTSNKNLYNQASKFMYYLAYGE